jgi:hypothetical protein
MKPLIQFTYPRSISGRFIALIWGWFAQLASIAFGVLPPPDGGYPGGNTAEGQAALFSLTAGGLNNTAVGFLSLKNNTEGDYNTALGAGTLFANTADANTAVGGAALLLNTTGSANTAVGAAALLHNVNGGANTATGFQALFSNIAGSGNTANGRLALFTNIESGFNTAIGDRALLSHTAGDDNTAIGASALINDTIGVQNTAIGAAALLSNTGGGFNTAIGATALASNTIGDINTGIGYGALYSNTAVGFKALYNTTGDNNAALGVLAGVNVTTANNVIAVGHYGENVNNTTWIGHIYGVTTQSGTTAPVIISDQGQLGTAPSSERFKKDISSMEKTSEAILSLRPVTFHYKTDTKGIPQFGLIAEEVAKVNPALVLPDKEGKPYTVRYDAVNAMLLNEFLKEHRRVQELEANGARQQKQIDALTAGLQKVRAEVQSIRPVPPIASTH